MIRQVIRAAKAAGIRVALCGEMAGDPLCAIILVGLGIDELSMNAGIIPVVKQVVRRISLEQAKAFVDTIMTLDTAAQVREFIQAEMRPLIPDLDAKDYQGPAQQG
jgi:phosphotransferase system enzyme I (PtsI)